MRFKLKFGQHIQANPDYREEAAGDNPDVKKELVFNADGSGAGHTIETDTDLIKLLGDNGKFVRLGDRKGARPAKPVNAAHRGTAPTPGLPSEPDEEEEIEEEDDEPTSHAPLPAKKGVTEAELSGLTVAQLKDYAADHEVDLKGATTKSAILAAILARG